MIAIPSADSGGDEFLVIIEDLDNQRQIEKLADKILSNIILPVKVQGNDLSVTCSIGIAVFPDQGDDFDSLCGKADLAMYAAKFKGKNNYLFYNDKMGEDAQSDISLIADLRVAVSNNELWLAYQPKIDLANGKVIGAEALLRWNHPRYGLLMPNHFIHLAEMSGCIIDIGKWVIQQACKQCRHWHQSGFSGLTVAVNVSPLQFKRGDLTEVVLQALQQYELDGSCLEMELTESLFLEHSATMLDCLSRLSQTGVHFSIDDFGTGYSNLGYLKNLQIGTLKIDMSFVQLMLTSHQEKTIVTTIIQMASNLGLKTIAEGVDSTAQSSSLHQLGCDFAQGYLWSKPLPDDEFIQYLQTQAN
ncbi:putative bifunctional diguanylate cyclase/phosphodiesterase [Neptunicella sp.]|uniref:putative bifunctional diguanylate cyclase/phosphodiesterase n=1 Tax=Neptunicella sp. TaxID=2125986 RepID=UPI003F6941E1